RVRRFLWLSSPRGGGRGRFSRGGRLLPVGERIVLRCWLSSPRIIVLDDRWSGKRTWGGGRNPRRRRWPVRLTRLRPGRGRRAGSRGGRGRFLGSGGFAGATLRRPGGVHLNRRRAGIGAKHNDVAHTQWRRAFQRAAVDERQAVAHVLKDPLPLMDKQRAMFGSDRDGWHLQISFPRPADHQRFLNRPIGKIEQTFTQSMTQANLKTHVDTLTAIPHWQDYKRFRDKTLRIFPISRYDFMQGRNPSHEQDRLEFPRASR